MQDCLHQKSITFLCNNGCTRSELLLTCDGQQWHCIPHNKDNTDISTIMH
jgi:hypothetical protein